MSRLLSWFRRRWHRKDSQHPDRPTVAERLRIYRARRMSLSFDFGLWLRTVDNLERPLTKTEYKVIVGLINQAYDYEVPWEVWDRLHWFLEKKDTCSTCGDERCGCEFHQQTCSHIMNEYAVEQARDGLL